MKQSPDMYAQHINPIKIALIFAFSIVFLAVAYKATQSNADVRSRASGDCLGKWKSAGKKKVCKMVKNKKGVAREVCSMEMQYYCAKEEKTQITSTPKPLKCEKQSLCDGDGNCSTPTWKCPPGVTPPVGTLQEVQP